MPVRTLTRTPTRRGQDDFRLPWWGLVLPMAAFAILFILVLHPFGARAGDGGPHGVGVVEKLGEAALGAFA